MQLRPLGSTGIRVSELCLGAMRFGALGNRDRDDCVRIVHRALDAGITTFNTADGYSGGESEEILGAALADVPRDDVVLTVKTGRRPDLVSNVGGGSRRWLVQAIEGSLRRLRTDWIDVYELGVPDPETDLDETLGALTDLARAGKIRAFGTSKQPPSRIVEARWLAERRGHGVFRVEESPYSLLARSIEYDLLPTCLRLGTGVLAFSPLDRGWLSGRPRAATSPVDAAKAEKVDALRAVAEEAGLTLVQLATAFAGRHPAVSTTVIGPRTMEHLEGSLDAVGVELDDAVLDRVDEIVPPGTAVDPADAMWRFGTTALNAAERRAPHAPLGAL